MSEYNSGHVADFRYPVIVNQRLRVSGKALGETCDPRHRRRAFTIIEIVITVLVIGIIMAIAVPKIGSSMQNYQSDLAIARIANDLKFAASTARAQNAPVTIAFSVATETTCGSYYFVDVPDPQRPQQSLSATFGRPPYAARLDQAPETIVFDVFSYPDQDATWVVNASTDSQRSLTLEKSSGRITIQ